MMGHESPADSSAQRPTRAVPTLLKWWAVMSANCLIMGSLIFTGVIVRYQTLGFAAIVFAAFVGSVAVYRVRCSNCGWPVWRVPGRPLPIAFAQYPKKHCRNCGVDLWRY